MFSFYEDERECEKCIARIKNPFDGKMDKHLKELCKFKTRAADEFWHECLSEDPESSVPYIMMCRSNAMSDYTARRLNDFIDRLLEGDVSRQDMVNGAYFQLHTCLFKESDKLMEVYRKIGRNYKRLSKMNIEWNRADSISRQAQPDYLIERYDLETENSCENDFFSFLTDTLILTMANAIGLDREDETFTDKVKKLYEDYPEAYASAGFFAYFVKDTSEAYEKFKDYTADPIDYPVLMWVLDGLFYKDMAYHQGSPTAFAGPENDTVHFTLPIKKLDIAWYRFYCEKTISDAENSSVKDPYYAMSFCRKFSGNIFRLINLFDSESAGLCADYFRRSAVIAGNPVDFAGLLASGAVNTGEKFEEIVMGIARRICEGRQRYCFDMLYKVFGSFDHGQKVQALKKAMEYISENERSERLADQRENFLMKAEKFLEGNQNAFWS